MSVLENKQYSAIAIAIFDHLAGGIDLSLGEFELECSSSTTDNRFVTNIIDVKAILTAFDVLKEASELVFNLYQISGCPPKRVLINSHHHLSF